MIAVIGEALIDLVIGHDGEIRALPGGGPFNTARTIGRLGLAPGYIGRLSADSFGRTLRACIQQAGATVLVPEPDDAPTTLAVVEEDAPGEPRYRFYLTETSATALEYEELAIALPDDVTALHAGSLALVMEPIASSIERLVLDDLTNETLVMIDPNCRPHAITDHHAYRARLKRILHRADVVKASTEDLAYLSPDAPTQAAAASLLGQGPSLVIVTDGPHAALAFLPGQVISVDVPDVDVVDTIGAGDAFGGAFLAWWAGNNLGRSHLHRTAAIRDAMRLAAETAALTCTRPGAEPPWLSELPVQPTWAPAARRT
jgi:fructokinase